MIWLLYILIESLIHHWFIWKKMTMPVYIVVNLIRGFAAILYGAFVLDVQAGFYDTFYWLGNVLLPFPFLFNTLLNTWRKKELDYVGEHSGIIDSFIYRKGWQREYFFATLILFAIAIKYFI